MSDNLASLLQSLGQQYPALEPHLKDTVLQRGQPTGPGDDRQLEFYPPWERDNPNPGKSTVEVFNPALKGQGLHDAVAGDMTHLLGAIDPRTQQPVDPTFWALKQQLGQARTPDMLAADRRTYDREKASPYGAGDYSDWDRHSRLDAYVRAGLFAGHEGWPAQNPQILDQMRQHLSRPPTPDPLKSYPQAW